MAIQAVVFDIGGVLEITPDLGVTAQWERRLQLAPGELDRQMGDLWRAGSLGQCSEEDVHRGLAAILGMDQAQVDAFMADVWDEYLGTLNVELAAYFAGLRPRYRTTLLSNSFVGARRREQDRYQFAAMTDAIIYSHEEGMAKPERRFFELACTRLAVQPQEMVFLDDVEESVTAAQAVGIHAVQFRDTAQAIADVDACLHAHA